jgi:hypothetical protein
VSLEQIPESHTITPDKMVSLEPESRFFLDHFALSGRDGADGFRGKNLVF